MKTLSIDIETYSSEDLKTSGVYRYCEAPDFEILLIAYSYDDGPVHTLDLAALRQKGVAPEDDLVTSCLVMDIADARIRKTAWNASFERTALSKFFGIKCPPEQWRCTMVHAAHVGLPLSLEAAAKVLKVAQKDAAGKALIKYFCMPCKPTKVNGGRTRNLPEHETEKWTAFMQYCAQDVVVEREIADKISFYQVPEREWQLWQLDQRINDCGVLVDRHLVKQAIALDEQYADQLHTEAQTITALDNPGSVNQLKGWLAGEGITVDSLSKAVIPALIDESEEPQVRRMLRIRQEMAKTSVKKYGAMAKSVCRDGRIRGLLQFYGANRTGRWAGRLVQVQNLPQNHIATLQTARDLVKDGELEILDLLYASVPDVLSQLIRTAFIAPEGKKLISVDFSAIEARVIAWLAGEQWRLEVFKTHGKIYEASAAQMFKLPIEQVDKKLRQKGKISELALGYGGGPGALETMGALKMGLQAEELPGLVAKWRNANRRITRLWMDLEDVAIEALNEGRSTLRQLILTYERGVLFIQLPSGRKLCYLSAELRNGQVSYKGMDQTTKQWGTQRTYGGKLVENVVQAIARDLLAEAMIRLDQEGCKIVMHVHDEIVIEADAEDLEPVVALMRIAPTWAADLPLNADGFAADFYQK